MKQAGVDHDDIDLFEPHDAYTIMTALTLEAAGFARARRGPRLRRLEHGIGLRGELPIATFGGLKARGHPVGASGCYQIVEAYLQLAGEPARIRCATRASPWCRTSAAPGPPSSATCLTRDSTSRAQLAELAVGVPSGSIATRLGRGAARPPSGQWLCGAVRRAAGARMLQREEQRAPVRP